MKKKKRNIKVILTIVGVLLLIILCVPGTANRENEMGINKENNLHEIDFIDMFEGNCNAEIEVTLTEGDAKIQILNEDKEVLWEDDFNVGTNKIEDIKLEGFNEIYLNVITTTGDGMLKFNMEKKTFGFDKFSIISK